MENVKSSKVAAEGTKVAVAKVAMAKAEGAGVTLDETLLAGATSLEAAKTLIKAKRPAKTASFAVSHKLGYKLGNFIWEQKRFPNEVEAGKLGISSQAYSMISYINNEV